MRQISEAGIALIKSFEGCRLTAYKPVPTETYWTIGWGHYGADVKPGMTITQAQADAMFLKDIQRYVAPVNALNLQLNQNQFDALVSFCYNCGAGNLRNLCLGRTIKQIAENLPKYNKGGGKVLAGLVRRRAAELALFNKPEEILYAAYQGKAKLGEFSNYASAVKEAEKWANSYVIKLADGAWVWDNIKVESEDDAPMKLSDWEKALLIEGVKKYNKVIGDNGEPIINSPDYWIAKINNSTITAGEIAILNFAILSRTKG